MKLVKRILNLWRPESAEDKARLKSRRPYRGEVG